MRAAPLMLLASLTFGPSLTVCAQDKASKELAAESERFRLLMRSSPPLQLKLTEFALSPPRSGWKIEMASSVAVDRNGLIYVLQRGADADPVIVLDREGRVVRSWGRGLYAIPHSVRIDRDGNVWTTDAGSSMVYQFSADGKQRLKISVGGLPTSPKSPFCGTTDIAFAPDRILIADGYANARIVEYSYQGKLLREWGTPGEGPGQFRIPHAIAIDQDGIIYIADRENGRIQRFSPEGRYLDEWRHLGKTFSLKVAPSGELWLGTQPRDVENGAEPWIVKVDRKTGKIQGVIESRGHHSVDLNADGEPLTGARPDKVLWFRKTLR
jgi:DNA-binding beta-propeller fold protein YncE